MIQRALHQIWIGPKPVPDRERLWCSQMAQMNGTWKHTLHGNELLDCYGQDPYIRAMLDKAAPWAYVSDRLRILLLRDEGGVYLDADCQPIKPLDSLPIWDRDYVDFVYGMRSPHRKDVALHRSVPLVDNTFIASTKGGRMVNRLASLWSPSSVVIDGHATGVAILENASPMDTVPCGHKYFYAEQLFPETIALHDCHNLASWCRIPTPNHAVA